MSESKYRLAKVIFMAILLLLLYVLVQCFRYERVSNTMWVDKFKREILIYKSSTGKFEKW